MSTATETALGTHSEVGKLRTVMVHRPDLAHERLSPSNCHELLFDDVIWVRRARQEFDAFVDLMRERGTEVLLLHELLAETLEDARRAGVAALAPPPPRRGHGDVRGAHCTTGSRRCPPDELATRLTGGITVLEVPDEIRSAIGPALHPTDFVLAPLPNQLFTRDTSAWLYGGVSLNPMFWPARQLETLNVEAIYRFHPRFRDAEFEIWFGGADHDWGLARLEGGDMMPIGDGVVLVGMGERSTARAVSILAKNMFAAGAARLVIGAQMPRDRAAMHLDTVFTFCDRDVATLYRAGRRSDPADPVPARRRVRCAGGGVGAFVPRRGRRRTRAHRAEARHDRRRRVRSGTEPVGRRQQRRRARAGRRRSVTSGTRQRTRSSRRRASRCSRSRARNWERDAAEVTA